MIRGREPSSLDSPMIAAKIPHCAPPSFPGAAQDREIERSMKMSVSAVAYVHGIIHHLALHV